MDGLQMQVPGGSGGATITVQDEGIVQSTTVTTVNFTGAGVTASGAGATATVNIPGGGSAVVTAITANVATAAIETSVIVTDASVSGTSKITIDWANCAQSDENHPGMDAVAFNAIPGTGQFTLEIFSLDTSMLFGDFKLQYSLA